MAAPQYVWSDEGSVSTEVRLAILWLVCRFACDSTCEVEWLQRGKCKWLRRVVGCAFKNDLNYNILRGAERPPTNFLRRALGLCGQVGGQYLRVC